jgi:hypothetical protein
MKQKPTAILIAAISYACCTAPVTAEEAGAGVKPSSSDPNKLREPLILRIWHALHPPTPVIIHAHRGGEEAGIDVKKMLPRFPGNVILYQAPDNSLFESPDSFALSSNVPAKEASLLRQTDKLRRAGKAIIRLGLSNPLDEGDPFGELNGGPLELDPSLLDHEPDGSDLPPVLERPAKDPFKGVESSDEESLKSVQRSEHHSKVEYYAAVGWQSADVYKGLDKTSEAGLPVSGDPGGGNVHRTSIWYSKLGLGFEGIGATATYLQSVDRIRPRHSSISNLLLGKPVSPPAFYEEVDLSLSYSYEIIRHELEATFGYTAYLLPDRDFWGTNYAGEVYGTMALTSIPFVRPNVTYSRFYSGAERLRGGFLEMRLDTDKIRLYKSEKLTIEFDPYVSVGLDNNLIGDGNDWAAVEVGARVPIQVGKNVIFSVNGNYGIPINESPENFRTDAAKVGFWGGASITVKF